MALSDGNYFGIISYGQVLQIGDFTVGRLRVDTLYVSSNYALQ